MYTRPFGEVSANECCDRRNRQWEMKQGVAEVCGTSGRMCHVEEGNDAFDDIYQYSAELFLRTYHYILIKRVRQVRRSAAYMKQQHQKTDKGDMSFKWGRDKQRILIKKKTKL